MGKKGKKLRADIKKMAKKAQKARNRAHYDALRDSGNNSKRQRLSKKKGRSPEKGKHLVHNCGNAGCQKCFPDERKPRTVLNNAASLKLINKLYSVKAAKPQVHPGRRPYSSKQAA